jgi:Skp family chaperone for outer membrane proteins
MPVTLNEKLIAYLALFSGLAISLVAEFYSIIGFTAIFAAAQIPVIIMGIVLGVGKIAATLWLKQNWKIAHWLVRTYLLTAIAVLMGVTSMGIFGFLSKAHSDQSLVSGDVQSKIAVYDEKIKTARENIDANRKALKQLDEAVDQVMGRSNDEKGAEKAVNIRRAQQKERTRLQTEISAEQKTISSINEERAPIAAEVRRVEAEVGPIKYIAQFVYGESDKDLLEKAVTWVIIILIVVFDPLAVILLLASQISFQNFREREETGYKPDPWVADVGEKLTAEETTEGDSPEKESDVVSTATVTKSILEQHPYLTKGDFWKKPDGWVDVGPIVAKLESEENTTTTTVVSESTPVYPEKPTFDFESLPANIEYVKIDGQTMHVRAAKSIYNQVPKISEGYVQNEEQSESGVWGRVISEAEYREQAKLKNDGKNNTDNTA